MSFNRNRRLSVQVLEDRSVPATFNYLAGTLTITPEEGEQLFVGNSNNAPAGYLRVVSIQSEFDSLVDNQPVTNIVVKMNGTNTSLFSLNSGTFIPGSVTITGAKQNSQVSNFADIGKNFTYTSGAANAGDILSLSANSSIGGNATIKAGNGINLFQFLGGTIGGNLSVSGGTGGDTVLTTIVQDQSVNGSVSINLGAGVNEVFSAGNHEWHIGKDFTYIGGAGKDRFDMVANTTTTLDIGGKAKFTLGAGGGVQNEFELGGASIGGSLTITGGKDADTMTLGSFTNVGAGVSISLGDGDNDLRSDNLDAVGSVAVIGGLDGDKISMQGFHVGKNLTVNAKGSKANVEQELNFGDDSAVLNTVVGNMSISAGNVNNFVRVHRTTIGGKLNLKLGSGFDEISIDDTAVTGATLLDLGGAKDSLSIDDLNLDGGGNLNAISSFGGAFTVKAGDGNDFVTLSANGGNYIKFGGKVSLFGGAGTDTFNNTIINEFYSTGNTEDFETDAGTALPV